MPSLLRLEVALLAATAAASALSIFAAQLGLAAIAVVHLGRTVRRETRGFALPVDSSVSAFAIWTLLSSAFAATPIAAQENGKKIVLFLILYFGAEALQTARDRERVLDGIMIGGFALATLALLQFAFLGFNTMDTRPRSFLGHYMTASGVVMIALVVALARLAPWAAEKANIKNEESEPFSPSIFGLMAAIVAGPVLVAIGARMGFGSEIERAVVLGISAIAGLRALQSKGPLASGAFSNLIAAALIPVGGLALVLSRTRSAWIGIVVGIAALLGVRRPRLLWTIPIVVALLALLSPRMVRDRFTIKDASSSDRYFMWQAGLDMILDKPLFGQGTGMILEVYPKFRWEGAPNRDAPHLHNNFIQVAAERGLPCALFLIWMLTGFARQAWRVRSDDSLGESPGAMTLATLAATLSAGMFEYNLGDSEILIIVLLVCALPFAASRRPQRASTLGPTDIDMEMEQ